MSGEERIRVDPEIMAGKPVIRGTRIPVYILLEMLEDGSSIEEIVESYPDLEKEDVRAAIRYARDIIERNSSGEEAAVT